MTTENFNTISKFKFNIKSIYMYELKQYNKITCEQILIDQHDFKILSSQSIKLARESERSKRGERVNIYR